MAFLKSCLLLAFLAVASAALQEVDVEYGEPAKYQFEYQVNDPETGDSKAQQEVRDGDTVRGFYTLVDADGFLRRVDYTADKENGFQAVVSRQAGAGPVQVARTVQPQAVVHPLRTVQTVVRRRPVARHQPLALPVHGLQLVHQDPYHIAASPYHFTTVPQYVTGASSISRSIIL